MTHEHSLTEKVNRLIGDYNKAFRFHQLHTILASNLELIELVNSSGLQYLQYSDMALKEMSIVVTYRMFESGSRVNSIPNILNLLKPDDLKEGVDKKLLDNKVKQFFIDIGTFRNNFLAHSSKDREKAIKNVTLTNQKIDDALDFVLEFINSLTMWNNFTSDAMLADLNHEVNKLQEFMKTYKSFRTDTIYGKHYAT